MSPADLRALEAEWLADNVPAQLRGLSLAELMHAAEGGLGLSKQRATDLNDLIAAQDAAKRSPSGGYDELLDVFGSMRREDVAPADVVRRWHAAYGGFLISDGDGTRLFIPVASGTWAVCDGRRLWRVAGNPFAAL